MWWRLGCLLQQMQPCCFQIRARQRYSRFLFWRRLSSCFPTWYRHNIITNGSGLRRIMWFLIISLIGMSPVLSPVLKFSVVAVFVLIFLPKVASNFLKWLSWSFVSVPIQNRSMSLSSVGVVGIASEKNQ